MKTKNGDFEIKNGHVIVPLATFLGWPVLPPDEVMARIAKGECALKLIREWRGLSQAALAEGCGLGDKSRISDIERRKSRGSLTFWREASRVLRVPLSFFLESMDWD